MSGRGVMAKAILNAGMNMGALAHRTADTFEGKIVDFQIEDLTAAGFSIVHKDEIHAPSVERCAAMADDMPGWRQPRDVAAALRKLS